MRVKVPAVGLEATTNRTTAEDARVLDSPVSLQGRALVVPPRDGCCAGCFLRFHWVNMTMSCRSRSWVQQ
jgi:hypothetical protein